MHEDTSAGRRPALDLSRAHFRHVRGDLTVIGTWFGERNARPALVIVPSYREGYESVIPCVVPLVSAWVWSEEIGDPRHAARTSMQFARHLGLDTTGPWAAMRVRSLIVDHLPELLAMPPDYREREIVADVVRTDPHGREHHAEISDVR